MSLVDRFGEALQRFDRRTWPTHRVVLSPGMKRSLEKHNLVIADVGAVGGPEARWLQLRDYVHFVGFDPLEPAQEGTVDGVKRTNIQAALGARKQKAVLRLMRDPHASTICEPHLENFADFVIHKGLVQTGSVEVNLNSLDESLAATPGLKPNFLKVDVEGADLDVLRGSIEALNSTVLGVRIEMSFIERHRGAPFFGDADEFLRAQAFQVYQLSREMWLRNNMTYGYSSEPQLAWGDAVYFLRRERFLGRLHALNGEAREAFAAKFVAMLLSFGVHDYAVELVEAMLRENLVSAGLAAEMRDSIRRSVDDSALFIVRSLIGVLFACCFWIAASPLGGARRRAGFYVKQRAAHFFKLMLRVAARGGPEGSCISD